MCRFKRDYAILAWNFRDFYPHFVFAWATCMAHLLFLLYPLVYFRNLYQQKRVINFLRKKLAKEWQPVDEDQLTVWLAEVNQHCCSSQCLNIVFGVAHSVLLTSMVLFTSWYIITFQLSIVISFALTMELVSIHKV